MPEQARLAHTSAEGSATLTLNPQAVAAFCRSKALTPAPTRASHRRWSISSFCSSAVSITTPGVSVNPITLDPLPRATQGTPWAAHIRITAWVSATSKGSATARGSTGAEKGPGSSA